MGRLLSAVDGLIKMRDTLPPPAAPGREVFAPRTEAEVAAWLGWDLKPHQRAVNDERKRFRVDIWHRRAGKTVAKVVKLVARAYMCPFDDGRYAYLAPTYHQAEDIAWAYLSAAGEKIPGSVPQLSKLAITIPTARGSTARIRLYGVDSPKQRLRGGYLDGAVADEYQDIPEHVLGQQVLPMLADRSRQGVDLWGHPNQWLDIIGTPKGKNQLYRAYLSADRWAKGQPVMSEDPDTGELRPVYSDEYGATLLPWDATGMISPKEAARLRADPKSGGDFPQEFECSFDAGLKGAIFADELREIGKLGQITHLPVLREAPVHTAWDLGWNDHTAIWFFQSHGETFRFIDYWEGFNASIPRLREVLAGKGYVYGRHLMPHDVEVHELGTGKTRAAAFRDNGIRTSTVKKLPEPDQIAAGRAALWSCWFDADRCQRGLDMLALWRREKDPATGLYREAPVHDESSHAAKAFLTFAVGRPPSYVASLRQSPTAVLYA